ncbi:MAG: ATP-binding protein [Oscillospiraceae bacterium]|nr:ATP-binding protein [Oscillospiraceae bacterium]
MLYTEAMVRENIRSRDGRRVFFLAKGDTLTPGARDYLSRERIEIRPGETAKMEEFCLLSGAVLREKPEQMTHLQGNVLVSKTHPRIAFRGAMDSLEAELLLCQLSTGEALRKQLQEILNLARMLIRCEVLGEPVPEGKLCGLTESEQRSRSHRPQDYYGQVHFMPSFTDGAEILWLNRCRCAARNAELAAARAFVDEDGAVQREDILRALNRMSSMIYILMIQSKAGG